MLSTLHARHLAFRAAALLLAATTAACRQPDGTVLYPVVGVGLIAVRDEAAAHVHAQHTRAVGALISPAPPVRGVLIGALDITDLAITADANVTVNAARAGGRWIVTTHAHP